MKRLAYATVVVLFGLNVSYATETALDSLRASVSPPVLGGTVLPDISKGYVLEDDLSAGAPATPLEWIAIGGGALTMGTDDDSGIFDDARPIHKVAIKTFEMSKTAVTVEQYAECVIKGKCTEPGDVKYCNWGKEGRQLHPVNCVDWEQANQYARFKGARLPSESEWEYAAKSGGKNQKYPWGNEEATCDRAVMHGNDGDGCGAYGTMPVCSKPAGNTAQGLCDMSGNVWQWVQDNYQDSYNGAPADGSAFKNTSSDRVLRGGSFFNSGVRYLRADYRNEFGFGDRYSEIGFRLARSR